MGPGVFFLANPDLPDILGRTDFDFENFYFLDCLDPKFPDFQVPDFQISRNLAWAKLGPTLGPAWARAWTRLGPGLGPHLGPGLGPGFDSKLPGPDLAHIPKCGLSKYIQPLPVLIRQIRQNKQKFGIFRFSGPRKKWGQMAQKWGQEDFFLLIQTMPTFGTTRILICLLYTSPSPRDRG